MKRVFFTEKQMKNILGETFVSYLNTSTNVYDMDIKSLPNTGGEITTKQPGSEGNPTLDKISSQRTNYPFYRASTFGKMYERNQNLDDKKFKLGKKMNNEIDYLSKINGDDILLKNMSNDEECSLNCLYVRKNRLNKMKTEDPERFNRINGVEILNNITNTIEQAKKTAKTGKSNIIDKNIKNDKIVGTDKIGHNKY